MHTGHFSLANRRSVYKWCAMTAAAHTFYKSLSDVRWMGKCVWWKKNKWQIIYCDWFVLNVLSFFFVFKRITSHRIYWRIPMRISMEFSFAANFHCIFFFSLSFFSLIFFSRFNLYFCSVSNEVPKFQGNSVIPLIKRILFFNSNEFYFLIRLKSHETHIYHTKSHQSQSICFFFLLRRVWLGSIMTFSSYLTN